MLALPDRAPEEDLQRSDPLEGVQLEVQLVRRVELVEEKGSAL